MLKKGIGPRHIIIGTNPYESSDTGISHKIIQGDQKVNLVFSGEISKVLKGSNAMMEKISSEGHQNL